MKRNYRMRDACFVCSSPYQIIGAVSIVKNSDIDADIYITGEFPDYKKVAENLQKHGIFSEVYTADTKAVSGRGKRTSMRITFFAEKSLSSYMPEDVSYKYYYASSRSTLKAAQLSVLRKRNPDIQWILFEDGMSSYSDNIRLCSASKTRQIIEKILGWDLDDTRKISLMVYYPELVDIPEHLKDIKVEQMPRLELNDENREILSDVFSVSEEQTVKEKYIIFDVKRRGGELDHLSADENRDMDNCYEAIKKYVGDDIILKPHPKSTEKSKCTIKEYPYKGVPMEALYLNMDDIDDRVLIAYVSTAVFTPKILLDKEPFVICLHNILEDSQFSKDFEDIYNKFKTMYRQRDRIVAPKSIEELTEIIRLL